MTAESYLRENIDEQITIKPWLKNSIFSVNLRNFYNFYEMKILGTLCILIEASDEMPGIDKLQKHLYQIANLTDCQTVLYYKDITRYRRKSLIENRIPFVIADGQMFLPFLGLDLKRGREHVDKNWRSFTASAQIAYLYFLYHKEDVVNVTEFAAKMGFSVMTASRALNDLCDAKLITFKIAGKTGRSKAYKRIPDPDYFVRGRDYLKTPVKKVIYAKTRPVGALIAGLDALAELTMINPPVNSVVALGRNQLNLPEIEIIKNQDLIKDLHPVELQLWDYDPQLFADKKHVDLLSLYASLKDETDERVEQALDEALRGESWYMA